MILFLLLLAACGLGFAIQAGKVWFITDLLTHFKFFQAMFLCTFCVTCQCGFWLFLIYSLLLNGLTLDILFAVPFGLASGYTGMLLANVDGTG
jgi:hypothetical protein